MSENQKTLTKKGFFLFLFGCIVTRIAISIAALKVPAKWLQIMGGLFACVALAMAVLYFTKKRTTGPEVFGGTIWWNDHRIVHAMLYALFAILAIQKKKYAWIVLLIDALYGLGAFTIHHFVDIKFKTDVFGPEKK